MNKQDRENCIRECITRRRANKELYGSPKWYNLLEQAKEAKAFWTDEVAPPLQDFVDSCLRGNGFKYRDEEDADVYYVIDVQNDFHVMSTSKDRIARFSTGLPEGFSPEQLDHCRKVLFECGMQASS